MNFSLFVFIALFLFSVSCKKDAPVSGAIPEDRLVDLYSHALILQEEGKISGRDSTWIAERIDSFYRSENLNRNEIESALQHYKQELPRWREFYEKVVKKLERIQQQETTKPKN